MGESKFIHTVVFGQDGLYSKWDEIKSIDEYDFQVYFIFAMDCGSWHSDFNEPMIQIQIEALNGGSHFGHEDEGIWKTNCCKPPKGQVLHSP